MAVIGDLEQARSALRMIAQEPFNAEAPPQALKGEITPTELHYVRSNFAVPGHDGTLEVGGAIENPTIRMNRDGTIASAIDSQSANPAWPLPYGSRPTEMRTRLAPDSTAPTASPKAGARQTQCRIGKFPR